MQVYWKAIYTNQYLNVGSHHPPNHKLGVICILYDCYDNIVTEEVDATKEIAHVNHALGACSYPSWSFKWVSEQLDQWEMKKDLKINKKDSKDKSTKTKVTLPFVIGISEALSWVAQERC